MWKFQLPENKNSQVISEKHYCHKRKESSTYAKNYVLEAQKEIPSRLWQLYHCLSIEDDEEMMIDLTTKKTFAV